jgi:hypothetical protein
MIGFKLRLVISALGGLVIYFFPSGGISTPYYLVVLALTLATSFSGTIQFVSQVRTRTRTRACTHRTHARVSSNATQCNTGSILYAYQRPVDRRDLPHAPQHLRQPGRDVA